MIDPATGWIEICTVPSLQADLVANQVELSWLTRYLLPNQVIVYRGNEFLAEFREIIIKEYFEYNHNSKSNNKNNPPHNNRPKRLLL